MGSIILWRSIANCDVVVSHPNAFPCSIAAKDKIAEEFIMGADTTRGLEMLR